MSVADQLLSSQPRIEFSDLIGSYQVDEATDLGPTAADLDWFAAQAGSGPRRHGGELAEPVSGIPSFPEWIAIQAVYLRSLGSEAADWLAAKVDELAKEVRFTGATSPAQHEDRIEVMSRPEGAAHALDMVRMVAGLIDSPCLADSLRRSADSLGRVVRARNSSQ